MGNYRPIPVLPVISKLIERIVGLHNQIYNYRPLPNRYRAVDGRAIWVLSFNTNNTFQFQKRKNFNLYQFKRKS